MENMGKERVVHITLRITESIFKTLENVAVAEGCTRSEVCRDMLEKGLAAAGYIDGSEDLAALIYKSVSDAMRPHVDRLASISAKAAQIAAASFFLEAWIGKNTLPEYLLEDYTEVSENARRLGAQYLKVSKDRSLDAFVASGLRQMDGDDQ